MTALLPSTDGGNSAFRHHFEMTNVTSTALHEAEVKCMRLLLERTCEAAIGFNFTDAKQRAQEWREKKA